MTVRRWIFLVILLYISLNVVESAQLSLHFGNAVSREGFSLSAVPLTLRNPSDVSMVRDVSSRISATEILSHPISLGRLTSISYFSLSTIDYHSTVISSVGHFPTAIPTAYPSLSIAMSSGMVSVVRPASILPTSSPTIGPTNASPSAAPSYSSSREPSVPPTHVPSATNPTASPSTNPTGFPTIVPSTVPTIALSDIPTIVPSAQPTIVPTSGPTANPSVIPSTDPTFAPSVLPTVLSTANPSVDPTVCPSLMPTPLPTQRPSTRPTRAPIRPPSINPEPTTSPTLFPTIAGVIDKIVAIPISTTMAGLTKDSFDENAQQSFKSGIAQFIQGVNPNDILIANITTITVSPNVIISFKALNPSRYLRYNNPNSIAAATTTRTGAKAEATNTAIVVQWSLVVKMTSLGFASPDDLFGSITDQLQDTSSFVAVLANSNPVFASVVVTQDIQSFVATTLSPSLFPTAAPSPTSSLSPTLSTTSTASAPTASPTLRTNQHQTNNQHLLTNVLWIVVAISCSLGLTCAVIGYPILHRIFCQRSRKIDIYVTSSSHQPDADQQLLHELHESELSNRNAEVNNQKSKYDEDSGLRDIDMSLPDVPRDEIVIPAMLQSNQIVSNNNTEDKYISNSNESDKELLSTSRLLTTSEAALLREIVSHKLNELIRIIESDTTFKNVESSMNANDSKQTDICANELLSPLARTLLLSVGNISLDTNTASVGGSSGEATYGAMLPSIINRQNSLPPVSPVKGPSAKLNWKSFRYANPLSPINITTDGKVMSNTNPTSNSNPNSRNNSSRGLTISSPVLTIPAAREEKDEEGQLLPSRINSSRLPRQSSSTATATLITTTTTTSTTAITTATTARSNNSSNTISNAAVAAASIPTTPPSTERSGSSSRLNKASTALGKTTSEEWNYIYFPHEFQI